MNGLMLTGSLILMAIVVFFAFVAIPYRIALKKAKQEAE